MNYPYYLKKIRHAVSDYSENRTEINLRQMRKEIVSSDVQEDLDLVPILDFVIEFLNPIQRILFVIKERQKEEELIKNTDWEVFSPNYPLLTIKKLFENLYADVSPILAQTIIEKLDCSTIVKSDMLQAIEDNNFQLFNSAIHDNNVDYKLASNVCSHVVYLSKSRKKLDDAITEITENVDAEDFSFDDFILNICACYDMQLDVIINNMKVEGCTEEEIAKTRKDLSEIYEEIKSLYRKEDLKNAMLLECIVNYAYICYPLHSLAIEKELVPIEQQFLANFYARKANEIPFVKGFLSLFTKGVFLENGFDFIPEDVKEEDVYELIESCAPKSLPQLPLSMMESERIEESAGERERMSTRYTFGNDMEHLPVKLNTDFAKKIFSKAIEEKYIIISEKGVWEWDRNSLGYNYLAYMCGRIYCDDYTTEGLDNNRQKRKHVWMIIDSSNETEEKKRLPANDLAKLFGVNVSQKRQNGNFTNLPYADRIDKLFE